MNQQSTTTFRPGQAAAAIILASVLGRLWFVASGQLNLVQDEAQYWDWSRYLQLSYYSKGPLIAWLIALWTRVFGDTELGVRFGSILCMTLTQIVMYFGLARLWKKPVLGAWTVFILATAPFFMALGVLMTTDSPLLLFWTGAFFSLYAASRPETPARCRTAALACLALCLALGILAKFTMLAFYPIAAAYALALMIRRIETPRWFLLGLAAALAIGMALGFVPTLVWNMDNDYVGFRHVLSLLGGSAGGGPKALFRLDHFGEYVGSQFGLASPWWLVFIMIACWRALRAAFGRPAPDMGLTSRQSMLCLIGFGLLWFPLAVWSLHAKVLGNWTSVCFVGGFVMAAAAYLHWRRGRTGKSPWPTYLWPGLSALVFLLLLFQTFMPVPDNLNPSRRLMGWADLGREVERMEASFPDPDKVFVLAEHYDITAALAFYVPGRPRTYCAWFDRRMNQYDLWPGPSRNMLGWDAVYVVRRHAPHPDPHLGRMFARVEGPIHFVSSHKGRPARKFTLFKCYGYNGYWPRMDKGDY